MGKRHQASRRRAYGRRQHEVRERSERPAPIEVDATGITVVEAGSFEGLDEALAPFELTIGNRYARYVD